MQRIDGAASEYGGVSSNQTEIIRQSNAGTSSMGTVLIRMSS